MPGYFCAAVSMFVSCVYAPEAINNYSREMKRDNWLIKLYCYSVSIYTYTAPASRQFFPGRSLSSEIHLEFLSKKAEVRLY